MTIKPDATCPVLVITLDHATQRQETIAARLQALSLSCTFIPGVDGRKIDLLQHPLYKPLKRRLFFGRDLSAGEFGCVLAHREVYQYMLQQQIPHAVVLEDDAILSDELPEIINSLASMSQQWDLVRFLGREKNYRKSRPVRPLPGSHASLSRIHGTPGGAYGYMLNQHAAKRLLQMMNKNWLAIDFLHGLTWLTGLRTFAVVPSPVLPDDQVPSCIDTQDNHLRWDKRVRLPVLLQPFYPLTRGLWKTYLNICVKISWWLR